MVAPFATTLELETLLDAFRRAAIPRERWDHRSHLAFAAWTVFTAGPEGALAAIRAGILRYNAALGIVTTPTGGYHESVTVFWTRKIAACLAAGPRGETPLAFVNRVLHELGDGALIFRHYRRETLFSPEARRGWVPPDLSPL